MCDKCKWHDVFYDLKVLSSGYEGDEYAEFLGIFSRFYNYDYCFPSDELKEQILTMAKYFLKDLQENYEMIEEETEIKRKVKYLRRKDE